MSKGNFVTGFLLGIAAGVAAKYISDNKEEVTAAAKEKIDGVMLGVGDFVDYASDKFGTISNEVSKKANEYADKAKEQFQEIKETLVCAVDEAKQDVPDDISE